MDYATLGRTGLLASVISLGGGGHSKLGMLTHKNEKESLNIVRTAIESGINLIDTAEAYGTEKIIGEGMQGARREKIVVSTKYSLYRDKELKKAAEIEKSIDRSLCNLQTDYIDIYHLHNVLPSDYVFATEHLVPELIKMREKGKIRFLGVTEAFASDPSHLMLEQAVQDDCWDVLMVGFNMINQSARKKIFKTAAAKNIGVLNMFAVRRALSDPDVLSELIPALINAGQLNENIIDRQNPLGFLIHANGAHSLTDAAYRFCRFEKGVHSVLSGTGNILHLAENIESVNRGPLPEEDILKVRELFGSVDCVTGNQVSSTL